VAGASPPVTVQPSATSRRVLMPPCADLGQQLREGAGGDAPTPMIAPYPVRHLVLTIMLEAHDAADDLAIDED
jgi:hypothetical protein